MNDDSVKGNKQLSGKIKDKWGKKRTDNDHGKAGSHKESPARQATGAAPRSDQGRGRG